MSNVNKGTVILTGAGGFVGKNMIRVLKEEGFKVIGLEINEAEIEKCKELGAEMYKVDLLKDDLVPIFKKGDYLIHIAGLFKFKESMENLFLINTKLVKIVMEAASKVKFKHIIHFSTVGVYGVPKKIPVLENSELEPNNMYGKTKYRGELIAQRYLKDKGLPITIVRPALMYGPENRFGIALFLNLAAYTQNMLKSPFNFIVLVLLGFPCKGGNWVHFVHVEDVCRACAFLMQRKDTIGETYNIADDNPVSTAEFFQIMMHTERVKFHWELVPRSKILIKQYYRLFADPITNLLEKVVGFLWEPYGDHMKHKHLEISHSLSGDWMKYFTANFVWNIDKLKKLGFKLKYPRLKSGIIENVIWYKRNGWLP